MNTNEIKEFDAGEFFKRQMYRAQDPTYQKISDAVAAAIENLSIITSNLRLDYSVQSKLCEATRTLCGIDGNEIDYDLRGV